ncbi:MAG: 4-amino-4-deoxychorismate lyase [Sphingobacteriales bacterium]|jgi:4-amino-4-deoxychorismate lyase
MGKVRNFILHNDEKITNDQHFADLDNRAFNYGDGLFESMRMIEGKIPFLDLHLKRFTKGCETLDITPPFPLVASEILTRVESLCLSNKIFKSARVKLVVFRQPGGFFTPEKRESDFVLSLSRMEEKDFQLNKKGILLGVCPEPLILPNSLSAVKKLGGTTYVYAGNFAKSKGWDDVLLVNPEKRVVEATASNIFILKDDKLVTPPLTDGPLPGVMREVVMKLAHELNLTPLEAYLRPDQLEHVDEIWLTNSVRGVQWVGGFGKRRFFSTKAREMMNILNNHVAEMENV